ncbi:MAG: GGDEF domain-containing protein [Desulfobacterium sp.]|jgi:diguanylate cyclase (GGDEF)-like protein|nr:GGDEF domain-containing protein [Desulfobacterium sp.]
MNQVKTLNQIVLEILSANSHEVKVAAGQRLIDYSVNPEICELLQDLAENIAMLMVQKEGKELHLLFMECDLKKIGKALEKAKLDPLTGLANRGLFYETLDKAFERSKKEGTKLALILIDLDNFKPVNDTHGHDAGDRLLQQVASRIKDCVKESGFAARLGGDEFIVLLPDLTREKEACTLAETILLTLKQPFDIGSAIVSIDSSIGISFLEQDTQGGRELLKVADLAMYEAKRSGRGQCLVFDDNLSITDPWENHGPDK